MSPAVLYTRYVKKITSAADKNVDIDASVNNAQRVYVSTVVLTSRKESRLPCKIRKRKLQMQTFPLVSPVQR